MKSGEDFLNLFPRELSMKILTSYKDPSDLVRISAVSRSWRHFVITNGLCKHLSLQMFPQLSRADHANELCGPTKGCAEVGAGSSNFMEWETLERERRVYAFLANQCLLLTVSDFISEAIIASSTDNYPQESIDNTLEPRARMVRGDSYWSSKGQSNPAVPETLTYKLVADLCVVKEIRIRPFQAYFHSDHPIYSAKSVRFRLGQIKSSLYNHVGESSQDSFNEKFSWTYTSQEFEMVQENRLQSFKFPEPVLCIGGILQIELLSRAQSCDIDGLFYFCVSHVQVVGRPLSPAFGIQLLESSEKFVLEIQSYSLPALPKQMSSISSLQLRIRDLEHFMNLIGGNEGEVADYGYEWVIDDDEESDEVY